MATSVIINANALRPDGGEHVANVSPGIHGGVCIEFNAAMVASLRAVDDGSGVAWLIDKATASSLAWAIMEHKAD